MTWALALYRQTGQVAKRIFEVGFAVVIDYNEDDTAICGAKAVLYIYYKPSCSLIDSRIIPSYSYRAH